MDRKCWSYKRLLVMALILTTLQLAPLRASAVQDKEAAVGTIAGPYAPLEGLAQFQKDTGQKEVKPDNTACKEYRGGPGQCVWFVKAVRAELAGKIFPKDRYGLAWEWYGCFTGTLKRHHGNEPKPGAVMCFGKGKGYPDGHVAIVRTVN
ncbi:MAG: CHAP domain-containing protein, partial [Armatimonadetes bacterium]|nr:CHAP domain-containing protein [Armatimonadota bacterium]